MKFKKGDRVMLMSDVCRAKKGMIGTVMKNGNGDSSLPVEFDEAFKGGHACEGYARYLHGHWIFGRDLKLLDPHHAFTLVITSKDDHTEAKFLRGKKIIKTAEVNRYKDDEYSQPAAIHAIVDKMFPRDSAGITKGKPEEALKFTGKAVWKADSGDGFTKGCVYEFINGYVNDDNGDQCLNALDGYELWKEWFDDRFIAIVDPEDKA